MIISLEIFLIPLVNLTALIPVYYAGEVRIF